MKRRHFQLFIASLLSTTLTPQLTAAQQPKPLPASRHAAYQLFIQGQQYVQQGNAPAALECLEAALAFYQQEGHAMSIANTRLWLGMAHGGLGNWPAAEANIQAAIDWFLFNEYLTLGSAGLRVAGRMYEQRADYPQAIALYEQALTLADEVIAGLKVPTLQAGLRQLQDEILKPLMGLYRRQQNFEKALEQVEKAKARAFLDQIAYGAIDFQRGNSQFIVEELRSLEQQLYTLRQELANLKPRRLESQAIATRIGQVESEIDRLNAEYARRFEDLQTQSPEIANLQQVSVSTLAEIRADLEAETTLINYLVADEMIFAVVVSATLLTAVAIPIVPDEVAQTIVGIASTNQGGNGAQAAHPAPLRQLYQTLIAPLREHLQTPNLGIIPHSVLHYVPFAALTDGEHYLCEDYTLFSLPSASVLRFLARSHQKQRTGEVLLMGNPTTRAGSLDGAQVEVEAIAAQWNATAYTEAQATEARFWQAAPTAEIIHLAAHGKFNLAQPLFSVVHLARSPEQDGDLEVHELYNLNLDAARLVVLSACETQATQLTSSESRQKPGDEIVALNRSFLFAGSPTVLATLKAVGDDTTQKLMVRFYDQLQNGVSKAKALQTAMLALKEQDISPYRWGIYVLTGDWREL
ncbi:MAG: CHAT domain-containing protein [Cyanobacteria bacterium P01_G01_bin.54]